MEYGGLGTDEMIFVLDALRPAIYDANALARAESSYFGLMRRYFSVEASKRGHTVLDLQPRFVDEHKASGRTFELPGDEHWNSSGHKICAETIAGSSAFRRAFKQ